MTPCAAPTFRGSQHGHDLPSRLPNHRPELAWVEHHFHLLPGVDDGPRSVEDSVELARAAIRDGTRTLVTTPHVNRDCLSDPLEVPERVREFAACLARERVRLRVLPGGEVAHDMVERLSDRQLEAIAHGPPDRRWVLLEAPLGGLDVSYTEAADELRERGFGVVVAHPERAHPRSEAPAVLEHELTSGSALQLNCWSLAGLYGEQVRTAALRLTDSPRVVIASDAHGGDRMPAMTLGIEALRASGRHDPRRLAETYPRLLLEEGLRLRSPRSSLKAHPLSGRTQ